MILQECDASTTDREPPPPIGVRTWVGGARASAHGTFVVPDLIGLQRHGPESSIHAPHPGGWIAEDRASRLWSGGPARYITDKRGSRARQGHGPHVPPRGSDPVPPTRGTLSTARILRHRVNRHSFPVRSSHGKSTYPDSYPWVTIVDRAVDRVWTSAAADAVRSAVRARGGLNPPASSGRCVVNSAPAVSMPAERHPEWPRSRRRIHPTRQVAAAGGGAG